jgi:hypothetical protein
MIDTLGLAISHGLILLAAWRLFLRPDLDNEHPGETGFRPKGRPRA